MFLFQQISLWLIAYSFYFPFVISENANTICAILHSGQNYQDKEFTFENGQHVSVFDEQYISTTQEIWNKTESIRISDGCTFTACNESYFDGFCKKFQNSVSKIEPVTLQVMGSANCTCSAQCKCTGIDLRRSECARAYVKPGCNSCNAYYVDFRNEKEFVDDNFKNKISSIIIREGCELEIFENEEFDGESKIFRGIVQNLDEDVELGSYRCQCTNNFPTKARKKSNARTKHYPPMISIPESADAIRSLLRVHPGHEGLISSLKSIKHKRSPKHAYILLLGLTGSGKSSAINLLFDNPNVTRVGDGKSTTSDIHEFRIPVPVDEFGISNSELRVIDTPGLGDTRGLEQDARFLATLEDYLNGHEELSKYIPNVVLVFSKFHDNRFHGVGANFVKMLRGFDLFQNRMMDKKFSNVIFVLSHYMSELKAVTRKPAERLKAFKKTITDFSLFAKPITICVAENKANEEGLAMLNGYYKLPNGDFYPKNLFDKIQMATSAGGDPIGEAIIRAAFQNSDDFNVTSSTFPLVNSNHAQVLKYLKVLSGANFKVNDTEISRMLEVAFDSLNDTLKRQFPDSLPYLQLSFNIRNIHQLKDVPRTNVGILKLLKEIRLNAASTAIIEKAFSISVPTLAESTLTAGFNYNAFEDKQLKSSPLQRDNKLISDMVYEIPDFLTCRLQNEKKSIYKAFRTSDEYYEYRMQNLNVQISGGHNRRGFQGKPKSGYNVLSKSSNSEYTVSALQEYRNYQLDLNDNYQLSPEFKRTLQNLPPYNESDYTTVEIWQDFFNEFGTHVVRSAHGGGSIEILLKTKDPSSLSVAAAMFSIIEAAEDVTATGSSNITINYNYTLKFSGGDFRYHVSSFAGMSAAATVELLERWKESLPYNPVALEGDMKLLHMSEIAKKVGLNIAQEIQRASLALFNATLSYRPLQEFHTYENVPSVPDPREKVKMMLAEMKESDDQFSALMQVVRSNFKTSGDRFELFLRELKDQASRAAANQARIKQEQIEWEEEQDRKRELQRLEDWARDLKRANDLELYKLRLMRQLVY